MRITISERLRPFSHRPGQATLIPGTTLVAFIYPNKLVVHDQFEGNQIADLDLSITGPVREFTVEQDLEQGCVTVWGQTEGGFVRYRLLPLTGGRGVQLAVDKGPKQFLGGQETMLIGEEGDLADVGIDERLSLGMSKKLEWDRVRQRADLREILPVWHRLGMMTPGGVAVPDGTSLFNDEAPPWLDLFLAGFRGLFAPTAEDTLHQGFARPPLPPGSDPTVLLTQGAHKIRALFVEEHDGVLSLRPPFESGRMTGVTCSFGTLAFEWTKKALRRAILRVDNTQTVDLRLAPDTKQFRLRVGKESRTLDAGTPFDVSQGQIVYLDHFKK